MSNYAGRYNNNYNTNYYNKNKRKNTEEDDEDYKKQRLASDSMPSSAHESDELEAIIYKTGEQNERQQQQSGSNYSIESSIEHTCSYILSQASTEKRSEIINILIECASKLPEKLSIYTTLLGLLNVKNTQFVEEFLSHLAASLKENLSLGHFFIVHRLIRFISDLVNTNVVSSKSILNIYEKFVDTVHETNSPQVRTDFYIYCVLSSIPWNALVLYERHGPEFDEILEAVKTYIGKRQKDYLPLLKVWSNDDPHPQEEYLDCIWIQIKKLEDNDWRETQIIRPYQAFKAALAEAAALCHDFPAIVPPEMNDSAIFPLPRVIFRMFDYTDVPEEFILPGAHSIERFLVEEQLHSVINSYYIDRKLCATKLLQLNVANKIPLNYMIVEIVFGQLFNLPKSPQIELFYGSLLLELCKIKPDAVPLVLAQATELIYDRIDHMKTSCIERFASWFAYHLSNFQYKWSWEDWKECVNQETDSPKNKFLKESLTRCMRLSYHQRICDIIPEAMAKLVPASPKTSYKYESEEAASLEGTGCANKLLELFKERAIPEDVFQVLRDIPDSFNENENEFDTFNPLKIEVFTSTLLFFGSKSFSHAFAALAKYHMIFKMLVDSEKSQLVVLKALHDVWRNHQQMMVVMVDKMLKTQIVECSSVASWIFSSEMSSELTSFYSWEILHSTVNRMSKQVDKVKNEYKTLIENSKKSNLDADMNQNERNEEELEQKLATLNALKDQQKSLFFTIISRFIETLNAYLNKLEDERKELSPHWFKWMSERFEDVLLIHNEEILPYLDDLKTQLFTSNTHIYLNKVFKMYAAFKK